MCEDRLCVNAVYEPLLTPLGPAWPLGVRRGE